MATAKVDTDAYALQFDLDSIGPEQLGSFVESMADMEDGTTRQRAQALKRLPAELGPFVVRKDGTSMADGEALAFTRSLSLNQIYAALAELNKSAVPPQNGSA